MEVLNAQPRTERGSRAAQKLRAADMVPGIIYGHKEEPVAFAVALHDFKLVLQHGERLLEMELNGERGNFLVKEVQYDTFGVKLIHIDLARVNLDETVEVTVPVVLRGTPVGEVDGGVLAAGLTEIEIECVVTNIPEELRVRVNDMKVGDVLHVRNLPPFEDVTFLTDGDAIVASCQLVAEEEEAPAEGEAAEGEGAEPEVIGKGKKEEEAEAEEG